MENTSWVKKYIMFSRIYSMLVSYLLDQQYVRALEMCSIKAPRFKWPGLEHCSLRQQWKNSFTFNQGHRGTS